MSKSFNKTYKLLTDNDLEFILKKIIPKSRYKRYFKNYKLYFADEEEFKSFCGWLKKNKPSRDKNIEDNLLHTENYYYDENRDIYVVHLPSKNRPFAIRGEFWRSIRSSYSNWDESPSTVNEICRKFSLSRRTVIELIRCMGLTHDSSPYTDEYMAVAEEEELVKDLLRQKEERILVKSQRKQWAKVKKEAERYRDLSRFLDEVKSRLSDIEVSELELEEYNHSEYIAIISPTDFHWGKLGSSYMLDPYSRPIAKDRLFTATKDLLERISIRGLPERIFLAIGGDGLHIDNQQKATTRGTPQDCDGSPSELAASYVRLCVEYVEFVKQYCNVTVFVVPGNHDFYTSAILREAISAWFRKDDSVDVFDDLNSRQTTLYGNSLISFIHGDNGSIKDYPTILASEKALMWGKSKWRFIFCGHLHTERELPQFGDTVVYRMPSLAGTDEYHFNKGYKSRKALVAYIVDKELGVVATEIHPVVKI
jgi:hypothetical protein